MSKIIKNGIVYGETLLPVAGNIAYDNTASGLNATTMQNAITELKEMYDLPKGYAWAGTQAQWDALTPVEKAVYNGKIIAIIGDEETPAENVTYDNTDSGLTSDNVQAAIDELNANDVGKKIYVGGVAKGEIFNSYTGNGSNYATGDRSHAEGYFTQASGAESHAEGYSTEARSMNSHAEGSNTIASNAQAHAEGFMTEASGIAAHAEGSNTVASGENSHAAGEQTRANQKNMMAIGKYNVEGASGDLFVIGNGTGSSARSNIVEVDTTSFNVNGDIKQNGTTIDFSGSDVGKKEYVNNTLKGEIFNTYSGNAKNVASGDSSHAEGLSTTASGTGSHAEGGHTVASNEGSHAEGASTVASGQYSHAEGVRSEAIGFASHASGIHTIANTSASTVVGRYNVLDGTGANDPKHLFIVGNGTDTGARSNILEVSDTYLNLNGTLKINNTAIGSLAMKSSATDSYTPAGTVSTPTISAITTSATVNSITAVGTLPTLTYDAVNKEYTFSQGTLPTKGDNVTVIASIDSLTSTQPTFTGTAATIEVS